MRSGFTLIELMVGVSITGILLAMSIPPIVSSMHKSSARQSADALSGRLRLARSQALTGHYDVIVYFNLDHVGSYSVHLDNGGGTGIPGDPDFVAANRNNGLIDEGEIINPAVDLGEQVVFGYVPGGKNSHGQFLDEAISFAGTPPQLTFHANGTCSESGWACLMPLAQFLDQEPGTDFLVELTEATGEVRVVKPEY
jgi:prepilin-type N-terminal cleavage/methylation domain-containing protein